MTIPREVVPLNGIDPVETTRRRRNITKAYLLGLLHDATAHKTTFRIATKSYEFSEVILRIIYDLGAKAWRYKEGKNRNLWIVEFSQSFLKGISIRTLREKIGYTRGYFDAEGGIAKQPSVRFYLYFAQKNQKDLEQVRKYLQEIGIMCGVIHNPSKRKDPSYWRFFIRSQSYGNFAKKIGSYHPEKQKILRMKI